MDIPIETIWEEFGGKLLSFIRARVEDEETAEDLRQDVFLRIHKRMRDLREDEKLQAWVYQIARNAVIDYYRGRRKTSVLSESLAVEEEEDETMDASAELAGSMRTMIEELPIPYREALYLTELEGLTQLELANRLNISLSGAKSRVQRGREKIKASLLKCCHFEFDRYGRVVDYWEHCCCCHS